MKTRVKLREENIFVEVDITDVDKPIITEVMEEKWQRIIDIIAQILDVPSGLIMKISANAMNVLVKSSNESNPYPIGGSDCLGHGLYCETVIGKDQELLVDNALKYEVWKDNPDVAINMIAYYGLPIKWPDNVFFGTICVLDSKENAFNETYKKLIGEFRETIESDLELLISNNDLEFLANYDMLTTAYNRRKMEALLKDEFNRYKRFNSVYSIVLFDLDNFKTVNDKYGHEVGDQLLVMFSDIIKNSIREVDYFGRWGGDEFLLLCPGTNYNGTQVLIDKIYDDLLSKIRNVAEEVGVSYGIATLTEDMKTINELVKLSDFRMYAMKVKNKKEKNPR